VKLDQLLQEEDVPFERMIHSPVYTSQLMAAADHVSGHCVAKPVLVHGDRGFTMCVVPASSRLNLSRLAQLLDEHDVRLASETEMTKVCPDSELGAEPPIGRLYGLTTVMDEALRHEEYLVFQAGSHTSSVKVRREDYERLATPVVGSIADR